MYSVFILSYLYRMRSIIPKQLQQLSNSHELLYCVKCSSIFEHSLGLWLFAFNTETEYF